MFTQLQRMTLAQARCWLKLSMSFLFLMSISTRKKKYGYIHMQIPLEIMGYSIGLIVHSLSISVQMNML